MTANNNGGKNRLNATIIPSGRFISSGYAEYFARIIVQRNKSPIKKKPEINANSDG